MFRKAFFSLALTLTLYALPAARAGNPPAPTPPVTTAPAAKLLTDDEARAQFAMTDAARAAAPEGTKKRADAAQQAENLARVIAWDEFEAGHYDEAAHWFARRAALEHENYANEVAFQETVGKPESDKLAATLGSSCEKIRARLATTKDPKTQAVLQRVVDGIPEMGYSTRYSYLALVETWVSLAGDLPKLLGYCRQNVALGKATLLEMQQAGLPPEKKLKMQNAIAKSLEQVGDVQARMAQFDAAERTYQEALALRRSLPEDDPERDVAESLSDLARLHEDQGDLPRARTFYEQALKAIEDNQPTLQKALAAGPTPEQAGLPQKDVDESLGVYRQSLILSSVMGQALALNNLGGVREDMGDYKTALDYFGKARAVNETIPTNGPMAAMLGAGLMASIRANALVRNMGNVAVAHADSGAVDQAIQEEQTVLEWDKRLGEGSATALVNLGNLYSEKGDTEKAWLYTEQAEKEFAANQDLRGVIGASLSLAGQASEDGRLPAAEDNARLALTVARQTGDLGWLASATRQMAAVRLKQGQLDEADALLTEAAQTDAQVGSPLSEENTTDLQGRVLEARGRNDAALVKYKAAVDLLERVRATTASASDFSNLRSTSRVYERIVTLLLKMGRTGEAFDYYNRAGSSRLQASLRRTSVKTRAPSLQALLDRIQGLQIQQKTLTTRLQADQARPAAEQDTTVIQSLKYRIAATQGEFYRVTDALRRKDKNLYATVVTVKPTALADAQASIPADVAVIEYAPLGDALYVFVATHDSLKVYQPPVRPDDLNACIKAVRAQLTTPSSDAPTPVRGTAPVEAGGGADAASLSDNLAALYGMLIAPIAAEIAAKKTLAFIPTQLLYYLPMQALGRKEAGGLHYLIEDKALVYLTGADVLKAVSAPPPSTGGGRLVAFGNPTGADLPFAQAEVEAIGRIFPASTVYAGPQATKTAAQDLKSQGARILHFATHGYLNADPNDSFIFLANGKSKAGQLSFGEIEGMHLGGVDLVTLSACQTALQAQDPDGSEVASLAESFSRAQAHTVVASLWSVADESTQTLMVAFYKNLAAGQSKAAALRSAELQLLHDPRTRHPYYWAPFILMGDWK